MEYQKVEYSRLLSSILSQYTSYIIKINDDIDKEKRGDNREIGRLAVSDTEMLHHILFILV